MITVTHRVCFQIEEDIYQRAQAAAKADKRKLANWLAITIERALEDKSGSQDLASGREATAGGR